MLKNMNEINTKITEKVAEYIAKGFIINLDSMNGSQGEIGKVDLTDGKKIIRIVAESCYKDFEETVTLTVGEHAMPRFSREVIWNDKLTVIEKTVYIAVKNKNGDALLCTKEEAEAIYAKRAARREARKTENGKQLGEAYKKALLPLIRRTCKGMKTARLSDISLLISSTGDRHHYRVMCRDKLFVF